MSTRLKTIENTGRKNVDLDISEYWGGKEKKQMLQITQGLGTAIDNDEPGFIQLTTRDVYYLVIELTKWIQKRSHEKKEYLLKEIQEHKYLEKTICKDAVDCERFISSLDNIEIPLRLLGLLNSSSD